MILVAGPVSEALAMDLDRSGVQVKLILPGAIDTEIWDQPGNDAPLYDGPKDPPSEIAQGIADAEPVPLGRLRHATGNVELF